MWDAIKRMKRSTLLIAIGIILLSVIAVSFFNSYFNESVFYIDQHKYKQTNEQGNTTEYHSSL
ncbi:hypothetical protein D3C77_495250 [compost metagenome]